MVGGCYDLSGILGMKWENSQDECCHGHLMKLRPGEAGWFHCWVATNYLWKVKTGGCNKAHVTPMVSRGKVGDAGDYLPVSLPSVPRIWFVSLWTSQVLVCILSDCFLWDGRSRIGCFFSMLMFFVCLLLSFFFFFFVRSVMKAHFLIYMTGLAVKLVFCSRHWFFLSMTLTCLPSSAVLQTVGYLAVRSSLVTGSSSLTTPF